MGAGPVMTLRDDGALVLFSGGQDSTTCLAWALERFAVVETIGFDYGQRHRVELGQRSIVRGSLARLNETWRDRLADDHMIGLDAIGAMSDTAMTRDIAISLDEKGLPNTFVPGRNLVFLALAAALAFRRGLRRIVAGMCETDYSGYPDCRDDTIKAMQVALNLGMDQRFVIETPLMWIDKAGTWAMSEAIGGADLQKVIVEETHTCYLGVRGELHEWGHGCGECPACRLRAEGFFKWRAQKAQED
jgi:7-cyano-7-deazaguanine synthase